ncbi:DUF881 domain-containing protein [Anaerovorax odorimutans]|uniref:DUF881 domain-containing protein n=1 Tax=Anaerovorax odorimutans TaxID=109327 RepID=A0ABT1RPR3_9FIRM|nr:DUF881 domain-containing protein [Anaerovorax odorimutans]MCQ4637189.1 DUF881 domain-containing protein [Anaerovorax odorimutans]
MKTKKIIGVVILCFLIGAGIVIQAKMTDGERLYVSQKTVEDYKAQIQAEKEALSDVKKLTAQARDNLALYSKENGKKMLRALKKDLLKNSMAAGTKTVRGEGVVITVDDGTDPIKDGGEVSSLLVHDNDILRIINELKAAGAEAVSVNGQRIIDTTSVSCAGYTVRINGTTYARPFVIRAIGDSTRMTDRLIGAYGYGKELQEWGVQFKIQSAAGIEIAGYDKTPKFLYMKEQKGD